MLCGISMTPVCACGSSCRWSVEQLVCVDVEDERREWQRMVRKQK